MSATNNFNNKSKMYHNIRCKLLSFSLLPFFIVGCGGSSDTDIPVQLPEPIVNTAPVLVVDNNLISHFENATELAIVVSATDAEEDNLTFSLSGADAELFQLNETRISFKTSPDFENPSDADLNNEYAFVVEVTDGVNEPAVESINVVVQDVSVSISGDVIVELPENTVSTLTVVTAEHTLDDEIIFSLASTESYATDSIGFSIDAQSGELTTPSFDFEAPKDSDGNNNYNLLIEATSGVESRTFELSVKVTNQSTLKSVITFPKDLSMIDTSVNQTIIRGTLIDEEDGVVSPEELTSFLINDIPVETISEDYKTWQSSLPLSLGVNTFNLAVNSHSGNTDEQSLTLNQSEFLLGAYSIAYEQQTDTVYIVDARKQAVYKSTESLGIYDVVSNNVIGDGDVIDSERGAELDVQNNVLYSTDFKKKHIVKIDLSTGDREVISSNSIGTGTVYQRPSRIALDEENQVLYIIENGTDKRVLALDLASGVRTIVSDNISVGTGDLLRYPGGIIVDVESQQLYLTESAHSDILKVDIVTGNRSFITSELIGTGEKLSSPSNLTINPEKTHLFVSDAKNDIIFKVEITSGNRTQLRHQEDKNDGAYIAIGDMRFDANANEILISDYGSNKLYRVNPQTGERQALVANLNSIGSLDLGNAWGMAFDKESNTLVIGAEGEGVQSYSLNDKEGKWLVKQDDIQLPQPSLISSHVKNNIAYFADEDLEAVLSVNTSTSEVTTIASGSIGSGDPVSYVSAIAVDNENDQIFVIEASGSFPILYAVETATGNRLKISGDGLGTGDEMSYVTSLIINEANDTLYGIDEDLATLFSIDIATGNRQTLSGNGQGIGIDIDYPIALFIHEETATAYIADNNLNTVILVELSTGERNEYTQLGVEFGSLSGMTYDALNDFIYFVDSSRSTVILTDRASRNSTILAH